MLIPKETFIFIKYVFAVATFDFPKVEVVTFVGEKNWMLGNDSIKGLDDMILVASLEELGYVSAHMTENLGSIGVFIVLTLIGLTIMIITSILMCFCCCQNCNFMRKFHSWIVEFLCWNFCIRLVLEATIELTFSLVLNYRYSSW